MEIRRLVLYSKDVNEQLHFYHHILGMDLIKASEDEVCLQAGSTELVFQNHPLEFLYHYCFLIPNGKLEEAMDFLKQREISLLLHEGSDIINFTTGRSIYFYDPDGNIAEFIERPSLGIKSQEPFSISSVQKVNEIGLPHKDPLEFTKYLLETFDIEMVEPQILREDFCWVGDYNGVFIVSKIGRKWIPTDHPCMMNDFEIEFTTHGQAYSFKIKNNEISKLEV